MLENVELGPKISENIEKMSKNVRICQKCKKNVGRLENFEVRPILNNGKMEKNVVKCQNLAFNDQLVPWYFMEKNLKS